MINKTDKSKEFIDQTIYIIQYPEGKLSVSLGIFEGLYEEAKGKIIYKCSTKPGSSGSPILNLNNKIIGIHTEKKNFNSNQGTLLSNPIKEFIKINCCGKSSNKTENKNNTYDLELDNLLNQYGLKPMYTRNLNLESNNKKKNLSLKELDI